MYCGKALCCEEQYIGLLESAAMLPATQCHGCGVAVGALAYSLAIFVVPQSGWALL
jgi:hypothetical protein